MARIGKTRGLSGGKRTAGDVSGSCASRSSDAGSRDAAAAPSTATRAAATRPGPTTSGLTGTKGGSGVWQRIISEMPEHDVYIEPFWGRGTIAKLKRPAAITIGIDEDLDAVQSGDGHATMFRCDAIEWLRGYFRLQAATRPAAHPDPATGDGAAFTRSMASLGLPVASLDPEAIDRASPAAAATFGGFPWSRHFVYLDPPYLGCSGYYRHEFTEADHRELLWLFLSLPCPAAISGYMSELYSSSLRQCRLVRIPTVNRAGKRVTECLWLNFPPPAWYHDTRFVGRARRERERIRRRVKTWSRGLAGMKPAERQAVFEACASVIGGGVLGTR